jgi:hypothetical protein
MRRHLFTSIVFISLITPALSHAAMTILEAYQSLPLKVFSYDGKEHRYPLEQNGNKWCTKSTVGYEMEATVDLENGYIEIVDRGTGGGFINYELSFFDSKKRGQVLALNIFGGDGTKASAAGARFFVKDGSDWKDVTQDVLPGIDWPMFYQPNQWNMNDLKKGAEIAAREKIELVRYKLPRIGTRLRVSFLRENIIIRGQYTTSGLTADESRILSSMVNTLARSRIMLKWDTTDGVFRLPD